MLVAWFWTLVFWVIDGIGDWLGVRLIDCEVRSTYIMVGMFDLTTESVSLHACDCVLCEEFWEVCVCSSVRCMYKIQYTPMLLHYYMS